MTIDAILFGCEVNYNMNTFVVRLQLLHVNKEVDFLQITFVFQIITDLLPCRLEILEGTDIAVLMLTLVLILNSIVEKFKILFEIH